MGESPSLLLLNFEHLETQNWVLVTTIISSPGTVTATEFMLNESLVKIVDDD